MSYRIVLLCSLFLVPLLLTSCNATHHPHRSTSSTSSSPFSPQNYTTSSSTSSTSGGIIPGSTSTTGGSQDGGSGTTNEQTTSTTSPQIPTPPPHTTTGAPSIHVTTASGSTPTPAPPIGIIGVIEFLIHGDILKFDSSRFGTLVNSALNSKKRQAESQQFNVAVSSITSVGVNATYYKAIVDLLLFSDSPLVLLEAVAYKLAAYPGFAENGFEIVSVTWYIQGTVRPTGGSSSAGTPLPGFNITTPTTAIGASDENLIPESTPSKINVIAVVVPVVVGSAMVVALVFGLVYYKKKHDNNDNGFRFKKAKEPPRSRRHGGAHGHGRRAGGGATPNIWLDMDTLPLPGNGPSAV